MTGVTACGVIAFKIAVTGDDPSVTGSSARAGCSSSSICRFTSVVLVGVSVGMALFMRSGVQ